MASVFHTFKHALKVCFLGWHFLKTNISPCSSTLFIGRTTCYPSLAPRVRMRVEGVTSMELYLFRAIELTPVTVHLERVLYRLQEEKRNIFKVYGQKRKI